MVGLTVFGFSTDSIGMNFAYPERDFATRELIIKTHKTYQKGLALTLQIHPRVQQ
mgnify:CR=1 FL=1